MSLLRNASNAASRRPKPYRLRHTAVGGAACLLAASTQALFAFLVSSPARCDLVYVLHGLTQLHTVSDRQRNSARGVDAGNSFLF